MEPPPLFSGSSSSPFPGTSERSIVEKAQCKKFEANEANHKSIINLVHLLLLCCFNEEAHKCFLRGLLSCFEHFFSPFAVVLSFSSSSSSSLNLMSPRLITVPSGKMTSPAVLQHSNFFFLSWFFVLSDLIYPLAHLLNLSLFAVCPQLTVHLGTFN